jgi:hypothetical protein
LSKSYMNLDVTYKFAVDKLVMKEPVEVARNAGADYNESEKLFKVNFLGEMYKVTFPQGEVSYSDKDGEISITSKILILHYLINANGAPIQNKFISFKELPDGAIYIDPFTNRAIKPMLSIFADKQDDFVELAATIGGQKSNCGDISVTINAFPNVPITYVMWTGDDEFPASGNILFDASASCYLPTEDYAVLSGNIVYYLGGLLRKKYS